MSQIIAIDCDEVLASTVDTILAFHGGMFNDKPLTKEKITHFVWHEIVGYDASPEYNYLYRHTFFDHDCAKKIPILPGALAGVNALKSAGYELKVLTSRWDTLHQLTLDRIETNFPNTFSDVVFGNRTIGDHMQFNKSEMMRYIGASWLIDDAHHNCIQAAHAGLSTIMLEKPWNSTMDSMHAQFHRAKNREDVVHIMGHTL